MNSQTHKQNTSADSDFLTESEINSLIQDTEESLILGEKIEKSNTNRQKISELVRQLMEAPPGSVKATELSREIMRLQKAGYRNPLEPQDS